jgi:hypothetical protein
MSYYIIPKIKNCIYVKPKYSNKKTSKLYISFSLFQYYNDIRKQIEIYILMIIYHIVTMKILVKL